MLGGILTGSEVGEQIGKVVIGFDVVRKWPLGYFMAWG